MGVSPSYHHYHHPKISGGIFPPKTVHFGDPPGTSWNPPVLHEPLLGHRFIRGGDHLQLTKVPVVAPSEKLLQVSTEKVKGGIPWGKKRCNRCRKFKHHKITRSFPENLPIFVSTTFVPTDAAQTSHSALPRRSPSMQVLHHRLIDDALGLQPFAMATSAIKRCRAFKAGKGQVQKMRSTSHQNHQELGFGVWTSWNSQFRHDSQLEYLARSCMISIKPN